MKNKLNWILTAHKPRIEAVEEIKKTIASNDGYIVNFNMFSDLAMSLSIEIEANQINNLHQGLKKTLQISSLNFDEEWQNSKKEWLIFINISFTKGKGNMKNR
ncbi:hypothetical protein [Psychroserpens damuponensis]|uniref:hypothetical protein n=1 Tax=Psychroserpens damuponensis TaxID=943936 RepID=UPI00058F0DEC|nr:hypothetical protein [Psychroserpens damuponensis]